MLKKINLFRVSENGLVLVFPTPPGSGSKRGISAFTKREKNLIIPTWTLKKYRYRLYLMDSRQT